jgi:HEAT repeat protein
MEHKDPFRRSLSILALHGLGETAKPLAPTLLACFQDTDKDVRAAAAQILGDLLVDPSVTVPALVGALKDPAEYVRIYAAQSLGHFGAKARMATPALIEVIKKDRNDMCRLAAIQALGQIGPLAATSVPALAALLNLKNPDIRMFAAQSLGQLGVRAKNAAPALAEIAKKDPDRQVRLMAINALLGIGRTSKAVIPTLNDLLRDPDKEVRQGAARANASRSADSARICVSIQAQFCLYGRHNCSSPKDFEMRSPWGAAAVLTRLGE